MILGAMLLGMGVVALLAMRFVEFEVTSLV